MQKLPKDLIFISQIKRDGSGTFPVPKNYLKAMKENSIMKNDALDLHRLSITEDTYIAIGFNSFIVKLKNK